MKLVVCGVNHKSAPLGLRERLAYGENELFIPLQALQAQPGLAESVILSTCNRSEIYCITTQAETVVNWLASNHQLSQAELANSVYCYEGEAAIKHMLRVATGIDSMMMGEPQIFGQFKSAFSRAEQAGSLGVVLSRLYQFILTITKRIRTETAIGEGPVSISYGAVHLAKCIFTDLQRLNILMVGAGETVELAAKHFHGLGVSGITCCNRTLEKANTLAAKFAGRAICFDDLPRYLPAADIVLTATASRLPILGKGLFEKALKQHPMRPMFVVDLALPRDVEPEVADIDGVYLYNIDDLQGMAKEGLQKRQEAAKTAETIIEHEAQRYMHLLHDDEFVATIRAYREKVDELRELEINRALSLLEKGYSPAETLEILARSLTNKLMHHPSVQLRQAGETGQAEFLRVAKQLLNLD
ncbi:MAG: glutamyl-tRNA reductase [Legionellales bacterium]|nr:glutamyl-tRNA reductase [Legionellales bacterium]|tara:strand:- start:7441 stop:8685 length:1245 start_codon:yes stop_codon:yes gene_type:complete